MAKWRRASTPDATHEHMDTFLPGDDLRRTFWGMIVTGIALIVLAVAIPGVQFAVILLGAAAVAWAIVHLRI